MTLIVERQLFDGLDSAMEHIRGLKLWPTTHRSGQAPPAEVHFHDYDVHVYIMKGETYVTDGKTGADIPLRTGDKITIEARTLHAEGAVEEEAIYIIGLGDPVPPAEFLLRRDPALLA